MDKERVVEITKNSRILILRSLLNKYEEGLVQEGKGGYQKAFNCYKCCTDLVNLDTITSGNTNIYEVAMNRARQLMLIEGFESPNPIDESLPFIALHELPPWK